MKWMVSLYDKMLEWSHHKHAARYLAAVSFVEASAFPIPPYFMLAPMALARPKKAYKFALIATIASVLGGVLGYFLGYLLFKPVILPMIHYFGYEAAYQRVLEMFQEHGFLALLILGITPMPYKLVAIGSGFLSVSLPLFILVSIFSRATKFFAVAFVVRTGGTKMENHLRLMIEKIGIFILGGFGLALLVYLR